MHCNAIITINYITDMHPLPLTLERKPKAWTVLQRLTRANNFPYTLTQKLDSQLLHTLNTHDGTMKTQNIKT